jgi:hypothetical protein
LRDEREAGVTILSDLGRQFFVFRVIGAPFHPDDEQAIGQSRIRRERRISCGQTEPRLRAQPDLFSIGIEFAFLAMPAGGMRRHCVSQPLHMAVAVVECEEPAGI